jgi:tetratricopeptide (TPR) repeat protein
MIATPSNATAQARSSRLVPILSAAALVAIAIAIAIVAYVLRPSGGPTQPDAAPATSQAPAAPADATPSNPGTTPAPPPAPAPQREPPVSITDSDEQQTESARALYQAGKYDEAARAAGRVLKKSPQNAEAQKLMAEVARYARQAAAESMTALAAARARAEAAAAPSLANEAYARAMRSERQARSLFAAGDYAKATSAGYTAQGLFEAAAVEALGRAQARAAAEQPPARQPSPPPTEAQRQTSLPPVAAVPVPTPTPAPPAAAAAAPAPPPPTPAPQVVERRTPDPQETIRRTLDQYTSALEARSLPALKRVWPGLGGAQERAIREEFQNARSISVTLESPRIQVSGDTATAVATRHYALSTLDGHELRSDARSVFQLRASDAAWLIESVRFEAAR